MADVCWTVDDHEQRKFTTDTSIVRVTLAGGLVPEEYDRIDGSHTPTVSTYVYSLNGDTVGTITVTYEDDTREFIQSVVKS